MCNMHPSSIMEGRYYQFDYPTESGFVATNQTASVADVATKNLRFSICDKLTIQHFDDGVVPYVAIYLNSLQRIQILLDSRIGSNAIQFMYGYILNALYFLGIYGIMARNLIANNGDNSDSIRLLDSEGCPVDPLIFPSLAPIPGTKSLQGKFEAFKFSKDTLVRFQLNVQFCLDVCEPVSE